MNALQKFLVDNACQPIDYETMDCARFVAGVLRCKFGDTPELRRFENAYFGHDSAIEYVRSRGGFARAITKVLGTPARLYRDDSRLEDGDVVLIRCRVDDMSYACGVILYGEPWFKSSHGVIRRPKTDIVKYWRMPCPQPARS